MTSSMMQTTRCHLPDVYHFQLYGPRSPWYHTRFRPGTHQFLAKVSQLYELHICTFGARNYAHMIAHFLDPDGKFFSHRILSRDECFNPNSKKANLKALFPCGDELVCIIDDREDVWNFSPNLIHVKPYHFFRHTGDIHAPPGLTKDENDEKEGFDFSHFAQGTSIRPKEPDPDKGKKKNKRKEDSSESELEEGELRSRSKQNTPEKPGKISCGEEQKECEDKSEAISMCNEVSSTTDDNKENDSEEKSGANEINKDEIKVESTGNNLDVKESKSKEGKENSIDIEEKDIDGEKVAGVQSNKKSNAEEEKKNKPTKEAKGEIKVVEHAKLVNDYIEIEEADDYLMYLEEILRKIHTFFYEIVDGKREGDRDLKKVIPGVKKEVLTGTKLAFSGLVPTNHSLEQSRAYNIAVGLGAEVVQDLTKDCTHLVAVRTGTAKVNAARKFKQLKMVPPDFKLVSPDWLWSCAERWERVEEALFPVGGEKGGTRQPPSHCSPPHIPHTPAPRQRSASGRFMDTINPLMTFSSEDIADMDAEVEDMCNDESDSDGEGEKETKKDTVRERVARKRKKSLEGYKDEDSSSSDNSISGSIVPKGWGKKQKLEDEEEEKARESSDNESLADIFRRGEELPSDVEDLGSEENSAGSEDALDEISDKDWNMMGAALEREFLEGE
ncbi:RNA polymerase II subunit A C-terminal domain phosphatase-like [Macrosteles quadrilineatus]|uniref:RNA polymerase II subunit A C-terminal domain phosphatase-like n=1 Tax=Macrosteles quadrilineatus TaxID=74068 RepID=UPI0023E2D99C|nr:RNA polymerase II subunit A C-terminal domain phosphatase-like [Macrosteles quadrilineatus]